MTASYRDKIINIQPGDDHSTAYHAGHLQARHAAAEIAIKADERIAELEAALSQVEWIYEDGGECAWCRAKIVHGHRPDCARQLALADTAPPSPPS